MSLKAPTKAEQAWMDAICRIGCIVCLRLGWGATPGEVHHILDEANRKISHMLTLCLCMSHHRANLNNAQIVSRHHWRTEFERRYGTEMDMHADTTARVGRLLQMSV